MVRVLVFGWFLSNLFFLPCNPVFADINLLIDAEDARNWKAKSIQKAIRSDESKTRARAAIALGRMQQVSVIPTLLKMTTDRSPKVRANAAFSLGQLAYKTSWTKGHKTKVLLRLKGMLNDPTLVGRLAAIEALGKYGPKELPKWLLPTLKSSFHKLQSESLLALFRYRIRQMRAKRTKAKTTKATSKPASKPTSQRSPTSQAAKKNNRLPEVAAQLSKVLDRLSRSPHVQVRRNLAYYFARSKDKSGEGILLHLASDKNRWVRYFALFGLRRIKSKLGGQVAIAATKTNDTVLQVAGIQLLQSMKQAMSLPRKLLGSPSFHVRAATIKALASLPNFDSNVIKPYVGGDKSITVQRVALKAFAKLLRDEVRPVVKFILKKHPHPLIRMAAVQACKHIGWKKLELLLKATKDKDSRVRSAAIMMLASNKDNRAWKAIVKGLQSKQLAERGYSVYALKMRKEKDVLAQAWKTYKASQHSRWIELREELLGLIAKYKTKQATLFLKKALKDPAPSVASKAKAALLKRGLKKLPSFAKPAFSFTPHRHLRFEKNPKLLIVTNKGTMEVECFAKVAPIHCANFVGLALKGFYNGLSWHRVISNFVIQGGDPDGSGWGDGGYQLRAEINRKRFERGTLGMPRAQGWNTGSVQLFFTHTPTPHLDGLYTVFGRIVDGLEVMDKIEEGDKILRLGLKKHFRKVPAPKKPILGPVRKNP